MHVSTTRRAFAVAAGAALVGSGLVGLSAPAAATGAGLDDSQPVANSAQAIAWEKPVAGESAEITFPEAGGAARAAAALSPYLTEIVSEAKQVRVVEIDSEALSPSLRAESVSVELFSDVTVALETTVALSQGASVEGVSSRTYSATGQDSAAIVTVVDGDVHGVFWEGATRYGIEPLGGGRHLIFEDGRTFLDEAAPLTDDGDGVAAPSAPTQAQLAQDPTVVDIMVAYDDYAVTYFGTVAALQTEIVEMINVSNMVYANSEIDLQLSLTNIYDLNYTPSIADGTLKPGGGTDSEKYLEVIGAKDDGILDDLHPVRDANGADLVAVISQLTDYCGMAYLPTTASRAETRAYSLTSSNCAVGNLTFTHEVGHNLCAHHDPINAGWTSCGVDAYGHFSTVEQLRTVMSYAYPYNGCQECTRIPYFSNPNIAYNGWTTGITDERNNSRVIGEWAPTIAAYRTPAGDDGSCQVTYSITNTWPGNVQVELEVANNTATYINGWTAEWTFIGDENVYNSWGVTVSQTGAQVTATGTGFGAQIPPGSSVTVGFQASVTGSPTVPASITCTI